MKTLIPFVAITAVLHLAGCTKSDLPVYNSGISSSPIGTILTVHAGKDRFIQLGEKAILQVDILFDGVIPLRVSWSLLSGPGGVAFDSTASPMTNVNFTQTGLYIFEVKAENGKGLVARDTQQVEVWKLPDPARELVFNNLHWALDVWWPETGSYIYIPSPIGKYVEVLVRTDTAAQFVPVVPRDNLPGDAKEEIYYSGESISTVYVYGPTSLSGKKVDLKIRF